MARSQSPGDFQYFWQEYQDIESSKEHNGEEEEAAKTPDEGEQEAAWLKEAGYGFVVSQYIDGKELSEDDVHAMTESLPSNHAAVIRRRVDTLNATLRKKQKYTTKIDVRNIFPQPQPTATSNNGADSSKERQDKRDATDLDSAYSLFTKTEQRPIYLPQPQFNGYHLYTDLGGEGSESGSCNLQDDFSNVSYSRVREGEEGCVETKRPDELRYAGSGDQEPGSPCGSPLRSKSSSCNTLDSLDSGLDSYHSNKDQMSSQDSLDGISYYSFVYEVGHFTNLNEMQPAGHLIEGSSPKARHYSVLYEDNEPPLVGYRKRRKSNVKSPRSPTSPRQEVIHPEWAANRPKNRGSFMKTKGGYSMSGVTEEVIGNAELGVEMLSMQQKALYQRTNSQMSPISDTDITFEFAIEENGTQANNHGQKTDSLPNFRLSEDRLGITHINNISEGDVDYVRKQGLLELTSLFDSHNITYSARRAKKKYKEHGIFGVPLGVLMEHDQKRKANAKIPLAFQAILSYLVKFSLDTEGILRVPGLTTRVKQLRVDLEEKFYQGLFIWGEEVTPNDVAGLMKQFLRELPTPLLTNEYVEAFAQVENLPEKKQQLRALNLLILLLPSSHRNTLYALLLYLDRVIMSSNVNKMGLSNVAMIMAPNLFLASNTANKRKDVSEMEIRMASGTSNMMKMLIKYRHILWTVPSYLMSHVRRQYELEQIRRNKDKSKTKFLAKKDKTDVYKKPAVIHEADFQDGVIRVHAPHLTKSCTAVQLDSDTTAGEIVSKFKVMQGSQTWNPRRSTPNQKFQQGPVSVSLTSYLSAGEDTFLYEVGGNIGERCLPNNTNMAALYKVNPNAEWIIRQRECDVFIELFS